MFVDIRDTRVEAAKFLAHYGDERGTRALIALCENKDVFIRREAVQALGTLGDALQTPQVVECLLAVCTKTREASYVRAAALLLLGTAGEGSPRVLETVTALCETNDEEVRRSALQVLGKLGAAGEEVLDTLYENLETGRGGEGDWQGLAASAAVLRIREVEAWAREVFPEPTHDR